MALLQPQWSWLGAGRSSPSRTERVGPWVNTQCYLPAGFQCLSERLVNNPSNFLLGTAALIFPQKGGTEWKNSS